MNYNNVAAPYEDRKPSCNGVKRGSIWEVDTVEPNGKHVIKNMIVISPMDENETKPYIIAIKIHESVTGKPRPSRFTVTINGETQFAICETMHRVNGERLISQIGILTDDDMEKLNEGLCYTIGLNGHALAKLVTQDITSELLEAIDSASELEEKDTEKIKWERDFYKAKYEELLTLLTPMTIKNVADVPGISRGLGDGPQVFEPMCNKPGNYATPRVGGYTPHRYGTGGEY